MGQPLIHFEIMGPDGEQLQKFYGEVFGWRVHVHGPEMGFYGLVDPDTSGIGGGVGRDMHGTARVSIFMQVPDLQATLDQVVARGGKVAMPPTDIPGGPSIAMFIDPAGNVNGVVKG